MISKMVDLSNYIPDKLQPIAMPFNAVYYSEKVVSQRIRVFIDSLSEYIAKKVG